MALNRGSQKIIKNVTRSFSMLLYLCLSRKGNEANDSFRHWSTKLHPISKGLGSARKPRAQPKGQIIHYIYNNIPKEIQASGT